MARLSRIRGHRRGRALDRRHRGTARRPDRPDQAGAVSEPQSLGVAQHRHQARQRRDRRVHRRRRLPRSRLAGRPGGRLRMGRGRRGGRTRRGAHRLLAPMLVLAGGQVRQLLDGLLAGRQPHAAPGRSPVPRSSPTPSGPTARSDAGSWWSSAASTRSSSTTWTRPTCAAASSTPGTSSRRSTRASSTTSSSRATCGRAPTSSRTGTRS